MIKLGIIGGGWPGLAHARACKVAGGFAVSAIADLIPERRAALLAEAPEAKECNTANELIADGKLQAVAICLPTPLHLSVAQAALKAGKHVLVETPPATSAREAQRLAVAADKAQKVLMYAFQRRFGGAELAAQQVIEKKLIGEAYHIRATWMRTRAVPIGTGWYTDSAQSGGGALMDLGCHLLDLGWQLLGRAKAVSAYAITHRQFQNLVPADVHSNVEDAAFAIVRFESGKSMELAVSWAINQAPSQNGSSCRVYGTDGTIELYTPAGPMLFRNFDENGTPAETALKQAKITGHAAMLRQFRQCILGKATPAVGGKEGVELMQMIEALYKSSETGKSVSL